MTIAHSMYRAISFSMLSRYATYAAKLASLMILARVFTPAQFGLIASTAVFSIFFQALADFGLAPAIINLTSLTRLDRDGLFSLTILLGLALAIGFWAAGPEVSQFYKQSSLHLIIPYVALSLFFYASSIVPSALMLRDQRFADIALVGVAAEIISTLTAIGLLWFFDPLIALASKTLIQSATNFGGLLYSSGRTEFGRPTPGTKLSAIRPLASFSAYQLAFNFVNYFSRNLDNMLVGRYMGSVALGVYNEAYQIMRYPLMLLTFAMTPAIQPVIAKHAHDTTTVRKAHDDFSKKLSLVGVAVACLVFASSGTLVRFILGIQWQATVPVVRILAVAVPAQVVLSTSGSFFQALGRTDMLFRSGLLSALVIVPLIAFGVHMGLIILCWCLVCAFYINFVQAYYLLYMYVLDGGFGRFLINMMPMYCAVLVMVFVALFKSSWLW